MSDDKYKYPSQEYAEMRESGIHLLCVHDGDELYECDTCGSVVPNWRTHVLWHKAQGPTEVRGENLTAKHMKHSCGCNCLNYADECCDPNCECHQSKVKNSDCLNN